MYKNYIEVKPNTQGITHIKVETFYDKGGMNCFTYQNERRGYYLMAVPMKREDRGGYFMESFMGFCGSKRCMKEVQRASKRAEAEADNLAHELEPDMVDAVCKKNGLEI